MADPPTYTSEGPFFDTEFATTKYGLARISQFAIALLSLILVEIPSCSWKRSVSFFVFIASASLVFSVVILILFCTRFHEQVAKYINMPLTLLVNEAIAVILWTIASLLIVFVSCDGSGPKVAFILAGILGFLGAVAFAYSAQISYNWFKNGSLNTI
ncbi:CKLF-like MARVEL transmembrane domain-containing protein 4 [Oppia nitens]|uniref:CKLF-like MARVEL transmembrane domain-containing protein 4 n=1 Tax=Oppia nitens TaxID=1686743 RepID=UPI0023DB4494|nr:CKLF-like MARVEL transmembrane domain-containing protein 4 [Oppia nitens]